MYKEAMRGSFNPLDIFKINKYKLDDFKKNPTHLRTFGTCIFCGSQGMGKTLSAVQYVLNLRKIYPRAILVSNVEIKSCPFNAYRGEDNEIYLKSSNQRIDTAYILEASLNEGFEPINIEYSGLDDLKYINNAEYGVIYLIDELHLELNSLESKNISIEVMVEISQQRKQRKHIVGTSQVFMRLAKPLREQIKDIIICRCILGCIQFNKWIDGESVSEENGKINADVVGRFIFTHKLSMYREYDTYCKMRRYNNEWKGAPIQNTLEYVKFER